MSKTLLYRFAGVCLLLLVMGNTIPAQRQSVSTGTIIPTPSEETYERVLELLFPLKEIKPTGVEFALVVRFRPSFEANSQIIIYQKAGKIKVLEASSSDGNVYQRLTALLSRNRSKQPADLARMIKLRKRDVEVSPVLTKQWLEQFTSSLHASLLPPGKASQYGLYLDGTIYELHYVSGTEEYTYSYYGPEVGFSMKDSAPPLVRWMNELRQSIADLPAIATNHR
jgi:hypothetical protein